MEVTLAFVLLIVASIFLLWSVRKKKNLPPGPMGLPIVGYLPFLDPKNPHLSLTKLSEKYGRIYSLQMGRIFTVVVSDVKLVRQALAMDVFSGRAPLYLTHGIMKGNGIICVQGQKWKEQRKFVVGWLRNFGMVKYGNKRRKMESDIREGVNQMLEKILSAEGEPLDPERLLMHSIGNIVFNLVFGKTWPEDDETWKKLLSLQEEGTKLIGVAGPINFLPFLRFLPKYKKVISYIQSGITYSHNLYENILKEYETSLRSVSDQSQTLKEDENEAEGPNHFLGAFFQEMTKRKSENNSFYTLEQFNFLMADLWGAGVDTTITTLRWFFLYTAHYQNIQENIQKEMDDILNGRDLCLDDIPSLPYLQASISEVQRLRSVTPLGIPHGTLEDAVLDGYHIPRGTMLIPLQWAIHMSPTYHDKAHTYDPSRFLDGHGNYVKLEAFIPFQTGKRMCLGEDYAKMMVFLYAGSVLQRFRITLDEPESVDFEGEVGITLTPKHHRILFSPRKFHTISSKTEP